MPMDAGGSVLERTRKEALSFYTSKVFKLKKLRLAQGLNKRRTWTDGKRTTKKTRPAGLKPRLNAPWVRALVKAKHSYIAYTDPVRCVRRHIVFWRQFRWFRRRNMKLAGLTPSFFRSTNVAQSIVHCYQILSGKLQEEDAERQAVLVHRGCRCHENELGFRVSGAVYKI